MRPSARGNPSAPAILHEKKKNIMQASPQELRARQIVASRSTASLCEIFEALDDPKSPKFLEESTVRGWIMDELEKRDPEAFEAWLDCTDPLYGNRPSAFFLTEPSRWRHFGLASLAVKP